MNIDARGIRNESSDDDYYILDVNDALDDILDEPSDNITSDRVSRMFKCFLDSVVKVTSRVYTPHSFIHILILVSILL